MAYMGSDAKTELSKVSLPVYDRRDEIRVNFLSNLVTTGIRSSTDGLVVPKGSPRYVNGNPSVLQPNSEASCCADYVSMFIGTSVVLWKLTFKPVHSLNSTLSVANWIGSPGMMSIVSSAY